MPSLPTQMHNGREAGTDEAGRGCLAGPVTAASRQSSPPKTFKHPLLNDSKKLTGKQRYHCAPSSKKRPSLLPWRTVWSEKSKK